MLCELPRHPDFPCDAVDAIEVEIQRNGAMLLLHYRVSGRIRDITMPPAVTPERTDELWKHTCFEAFIGAGEPRYMEFNFSPSGQWAAYTFNGYRSGMLAAPVDPPVFTTEFGATTFHLRAAVRLDTIAALRLGLGAVIEETNQRKSYWALAHPPGKPDFHHPDCFALELPPASGA
jgi:hypothetical protein